MFLSSQNFVLFWSLMDIILTFFEYNNINVEHNKWIQFEHKRVMILTFTWT